VQIQRVTSRPATPRVGIHDGQCNVGRGPRLTRLDALRRARWTE